jgi:hypothetical protein
MNRIESFANREVPQTMLKTVMATALAASVLLSLPTVAEAHPRTQCRKVWVHGRLVRRCRPVPHHHRPQHRPPPHRPPAHRPPPPPPPPGHRF